MGGEGKGGGEKMGGGRTGKMRGKSRKWRWIRMRPEKEGEGEWEREEEGRGGGQRRRGKRMKDEEFCPTKSQMLQGTVSIPMLNAMYKHLHTDMYIYQL